MNKSIALSFTLMLAASAAFARGSYRSGPYLGEMSAQELVVILSGHADAAYRDAAATALGRSGVNKGDKESLAALLHAMQSDPDARVRTYAASSLLERTEESAFSPLLAALADTSAPERLRSMIAFRIHMLEDRRAVPVLLQVLSEPALRFECIHSLGELRAVEAVEPLIDIVQAHLLHGEEAGDDFIRHSAEIAEGGDALGKIGDVRGLRAVLPMIDQKVIYRRQVAVEAISAICKGKGASEECASTAPVLRTACESDKDSRVRNASRDALAGMNAGTCNPLLPISKYLPQELRDTVR